MKYVIPEKNVDMTVWHLPYIQDIPQVRIPSKPEFFPALMMYKTISLLKQFLLETKILKVLQKALGNTLDKEGLKILMNSLKNALKILNSLDTDLFSCLGIGRH